MQRDAERAERTGRSPTEEHQRNQDRRGKIKSIFSKIQNAITAKQETASL